MNLAVDGKAAWAAVRMIRCSRIEPFSLHLTFELCRPHEADDLAREEFAVLKVLQAHLVDAFLKD